MTSLNIKTGDLVMVRTGQDRGKKGKVLQVFTREQRVVVEGLNQQTKNIRSRKQGEKGQRIQFNAPLHVSNVMYVDPKSGQPSRLGRRLVGDKKVRRIIRSGETVT